MYCLLVIFRNKIFSVLQASLNASKLQLTWTLLKQQRRPEAFLEVDEKKCTLMHVLAAHADKDMSDHGLLMQVRISSFGCKLKEDSVCDNRCLLNVSFLVFDGASFCL